MSRGTVVFLGAGASKPLGHPLTKDILPEILQRLQNGTLFGRERKRRKELSAGLHRLVLPGLSRWTARTARRWEGKLPDITSVLSLLDQLLVTANAGAAGYSPVEILHLRLLIERAIAELVIRLDEPPPLQVPGELRRQQADAAIHQLSNPFSAVAGYQENLMDWLDRLAEPLTIISTNYDLMVDSLLFARTRYEDIWAEFDFGIPVREPVTGAIHRGSAQSRYRLFKLHGSLNYLRCDLCDHIYCNPLGQVAYLAFLDDAQVPRESVTCHCGYYRLRHVMVTPSFVRDIRDPNLLEIWRNAQEALRTAEAWYIIGYSLPPEDVAIRSMLLRGYTSRGTGDEPKITAVQLGEKTRPNFELFFPKVDYRPEGVENFVRPAHPEDRGEPGSG